MIERFARIPVECDYASEFRYRNTPLFRNSLFFVMSQSGETIDTLAALREAKRKGYKVLAINNVVGSSIAREADGGIYQHVGPEVGVASTKAFTSQLLIGAMLALYLARMRDMSFNDGTQMVQALKSAPDLVRQALEQAEPYSGHRETLRELDGHAVPRPALAVSHRARRRAQAEGDFLPARRRLSRRRDEARTDRADQRALPECRVRAEERNLQQSRFLDAGDQGAQRSRSSRSSRSKRICRPGLADEVIMIPECHEAVLPIVASIPVQLLSYYIAVERGCDVDKPRNLAKSVTVE